VQVIGYQMLLIKDARFCHVNKTAIAQEECPCNRGSLVAFLYGSSAFLCLPVCGLKVVKYSRKAGLQASQAAIISSDDGIGRLKCKLSTPKLKIAGENILVFRDFDVGIEV
jgi:hypothetical protein